MPLTPRICPKSFHRIMLYKDDSVECEKQHNSVQGSKRNRSFYLAPRCFISYLLFTTLQPKAPGCHFSYHIDHIQSFNRSLNLPRYRTLLAKWVKSPAFWLLVWLTALSNRNHLSWRWLLAGRCESRNWSWAHQKAPVAWPYSLWHSSSFNQGRSFCCTGDRHTDQLETLKCSQMAAHWNRS
jgi:hypothetical protein